MTFASFEDSKRLEAEAPYAERNLPATVFGMLSDTKDKYPSSPAVSYQLLSGPTDKNETLTWAELQAQVAQAANLFRSLKIGPSDVVALVMPNTMETVVATLGAMTAGICNPINPLLEPEQISAILRETGASVVVTLRAFPKTDIAEKTAEAVRHAPQVHTVLEVDLNRYLTPPKSWIVPLIRPKVEGKHHADVKSFAKELAGQPRTLSFAEGQEDRVAAYFHTGGTTGMPKVAQHKFSGIVYQGWLAETLLYKSEDCVMCPLPLFHVMACHTVLMAMVKSGAHVVFPTPAGYRGEGVFENLWKLCERYKCTYLITVPTAAAVLMQRDVDADISTVRNAFSGSAPMPLELFKRFGETTGIEIIEGYGLTEATCLVSANPIDGEKKVGSVGVPLPYTDVKILRIADGEVMENGTDEVGEICVSNPGVWAGNTYTEAEKNVDLYHTVGNRAYLRTGDLGRRDGDGYLWITGRAKDLIIRGGHNIDPGEIEEALLRHPAVAFAGAIGQPDAHSGELPCAFVELVEGASVSEAELLKHCEVHVHERAAHPKHLTVLAELPKTAVGKVFKPDLRKQAIIRVFNSALAEANVQARVSGVVDDKKRGLVAQLDRNGADEQDVQKVLGNFTRPWEWAA